MELATYTGIEEQAVRERLGKLLKRGLVPRNVGNKAGKLLELRVVAEQIATVGKRRRPKDGEDEDDVRDAVAAEVLTAVLVIAVGRMLTSDYRRLLKRVLPLKQELLGEEIAVRRAAAQAALAERGTSVELETLRTYYEPRALDELAWYLVLLEAEHRGESPPPPLPAR